MTLAPLRRRSGHAWKCEFPEGCHRVAFFMLTKKSRDRTSSAKFCREHCESESKPIELRKRRRCVTVGCHRQASQALFAYDASHSDLRAEWCTEHAPDGSINVVSLRCVCESIFESRLGSSGDLQVQFSTDTSEPGWHTSEASSNDRSTGVRFRAAGPSPPSDIRTRVASGYDSLPLLAFWWFAPVMPLKIRHGLMWNDFPLVDLQAM